MSGQAPPLNLDITHPSIINKLFPFHFLLDTDLQIIQLGNSLKKLLPEAKAFNQAFDVIRPGMGIEMTYESMAHYSSQIFILKLKQGKAGIPLKGQFVVCPNRTFLLFCGSPWLVSDSSFRDSGLMVSDFAIHDSLVDLLHHFKAQQMGLEDVKTLNAQLLEKNTLLEQFNRDFNLGQEGSDAQYKKSNYDAFLQQYQELQLKVTQFASVELQLNTIRIRLDDELEMYKRMQIFSSKALVAVSKRQLIDLLAEAVIDIFETEGALVMLEQFGENQFTILKNEGISFSDCTEDCIRNCIRDLSDQLKKSPSPIVAGNALQCHSSFAKMRDALWFSFEEESLGMRLHVGGLISLEKGMSYHPLLERHATIFQVFAQKAMSLLANQHRALMIRRQLESEQAAVEEVQKMNQQLIAYNQELEILNRDLDQFVYSASHDLRAPALAISGILEELSDPDTDTVTKEQDIHRIQQMVDRLDDTITDIISYSKNSRLPVTPEKVDLDEMIRELYESLRYLKKFYISLVVDIDFSYDLWTDRSRLQSLIRNLMSNAIKFSVERPQGSFIRLSGKVDSDVCELMVEDNGEGINPDLQTRVFDMFYRASSSAHGTGLGLYICNEIIKKLGGTINLSSEQGVGTAVKLIIPNQSSNG